MHKRVRTVGIIVSAIGLCVIIVAVGALIYYYNMPPMTEVAPGIGHMNNFTREINLFWPIGVVGVVLLLIGIPLILFGKRTHG